MTGIWLVSYIALWVLLLLIAIVLLSVLRNLGLIYERIQQGAVVAEDAITLADDAVVPDLPLRTLTGETTTLAAFQGMPLLVRIVSPNCAPCRDLVSALVRGSDLGDNTDVTQQVLLFLVEPNEVRTLLAELRQP
jgi:hypothetical protein